MPFVPFMRELAVRESEYGRLAVLHDTVHNAHVLENGGTWHGWQFRDDDRLDEATAYYSAGSPIAELLRRAPSARAAVVGLGAGVMASLAAPGQSLTFYELDPAVIEMATEPRWFSFLSRAKGRCAVVEGDALARITEAPRGHYDLIAVDAYLGPEAPDATRSVRAVERYLSRLARAGVIAFHVTSTAQEHDHRPAIARVCAGLSCAWKEHASPRLAHDPSLEIDPAFDLSMPVESRWVAASPDARAIGALIDDAGWSPLG